MRKIFIVIASLLLVLSKSIIGQVIPQSGSATFNLPLFNWQDHGSRLNNAIALNYNSGNGLKVDDIPSVVGQGWSLMAGGVITRITAGQPDDQKPLDGGYEDISKYPPGYLYDPLSAAEGCPTGLSQYPIFRYRNQLYSQHNSVLADKELDKFSFTFNGRSGVFVLGKNNGDKAISLGDSKLKIWFTRDEGMVNFNIRTTINAFYVQDENGVIYKFSELEKTKILKKKYCDASLTHTLATPQFKDGRVYYENDFDLAPSLSYVVNSWYLSEILDPFTGRKVQIEYDIANIDTKVGITLTVFNPGLSQPPATDLRTLYTNNIRVIKRKISYALISHRRTISLTPQIKFIKFPDGHTVDFNYGNERYDLNGSRSLAEVEIKYKNRFISKYLFKTNYFIYNRIGIPINDFQKKAARLCLQSVQKVSADLKGIEQPYLFNYYTGSGIDGDFVPPLFTHLRDIWGYYNGINSKDFYDDEIPIYQNLSDLKYYQILGLCYLRENENNIKLNTKEGYAKNGLLKQIIYPTGGSLTYEYDDVKGSFDGTEDLMVGGVSVSKSVLFDGGYSTDCEPNEIITDYSYVKEDGISSSKWFTKYPNNKMVSHVFYKPEDKRYKIPIFGGCGILGCCKYRYQYPGILSIDQSVSLSSFQFIMEHLGPALSAFNDIITVVMVITNASASTVSGLIISAVFSLAILIETCFSDPSKNRYNTTYTNVNYNEGHLPQQYNRVKISDNSGYTIIDYTNDIDYPIWVSENLLLSQQQKYAFWAYGLEKRKAVYNSNDELVKESINVYDYSNASANATDIYDETGAISNINIDYPSCHCEVRRHSSKRITHWNAPNNDPNTFIKTSIDGNDILAEVYHIRTGRVALMKTIEKQYSITAQSPSPLGSNFTQKETEYSYTSPTLLPNSTRTTLNNGDILREDIVYSGDANKYGNDKGDILQNLLINNVLNHPVSVVRSIKKVDETKFRILNEKVFLYKETRNGDIKLSRVFENRFKNIETMLNVGNIYKGPLNNNNPDYKVIQEYTYDNDGLLINKKDEGGRQVSYVYDYDNKFVVATIVNADQVLLKGYSTYTSFETESFGGWITEGPVVYTTDHNVTGQRSFVLNNENALITNASHPEPFILSFWAKENDFSIVNFGSSAVLKKASPEINGFTYYEFELPEIMSYVLVQGNTVIDELRLYVAAGRMSTVTYDPIVGKTSECDDNNRVTYFEYDELGRIKFIRDHWKNVLKVYEYNVVNNFENAACPQSAVTYYNVEMSEVFRKNNCEGDYIGTEVIYTVPASTFSSSISQYHADQLAQNQINALGQTWANTSSSSVCIPIYRNDLMSEIFVSENCDYGFVGGEYTYVVPAGRYFSLIDKDDANNQAQDEIDANGQDAANNPPICIYTSDPQWDATGDHRCDGTTIEYEIKDMNPHSSTFGQVYWQPDGNNTLCGGTAPTTIDITYVNMSNSFADIELRDVSTNQVFSFNLSPNVTTQQTIGTVPPGTYEITISMPWGNNATSIKVYSTVQVGSYYYSASQSISAAGNPVILINN